MPALRLLALDLSTNVGWCFYEDRNSQPIFDTFMLAERSGRDIYGPTFGQFEGWLRAVIKRLQPELVAFEAPILPRNRVFQKQRAIRLSYGFASSVERICSEINMRCIECHPATVKVRLAGHGTARKHHMVAAAARLGLDVRTDHEADAIGVALVAFDYIDQPQHELDLAS